mmetsp:Transcript_4079/g.15353  ORF Transcript_4079/g.15353 Transcript_4079/m.15353 type:complete len:338 (-) Transcript_4079:69-1082(-)
MTTSPLASLKFYKAPDANIYSGSRSDEEYGTRLCHIVECLNVTEASDFNSISQNSSDQKKSLAFVGFCSDEGVKRNHGRPGAREGPEAIRLAIKGLPLHNDKLLLYDCGDIAIDTELEQGHEELAQITRELAKHVDLVFVLGGGHEVAYGHFLGQWRPEIDSSRAPPGVFNFDAHFDLRKMDRASSGTPFLQMHELCNEHNQKLNYQVMGIQSASNTRTLFETAHRYNVKYLETEEIMNSNTVADHFIKPFIQKNEQIYVTICLDVFNGGCAPGVSAVNAFGLQPNHVIHVLRQLIQSGKVRHIDIAEMNPKYDVQSLTARLAAMLVFVTMEELSKQ